MSQAIERLFQGKNLHHAYVIAGKREDVVPGLVGALEKKFALKMQGNPDVFMIEVEGFGIDEARELGERAIRFAFSGERKFFIVAASTITHEAQNALLKTLEEPAAGSIFFIVVPSAESLLATILSRVFVVDARERESAGDVQAFLSAPIAERLRQTKRLSDALSGETLTKRDVLSWVGSLEAALQEKMAAGTSAEVVAFGEEVLKAKRDLLGRSPSVKLVLDHIALMVPNKN